MSRVDRDARFMRRALACAQTGWGRVAPNPLVGAVVVQRGQIVAEGHHSEFGGEHAEVAALRRASDAACGATLYVTLEPCAHAGKTPACTQAILEAGIERVVYACDDPDPVAGGGAERLKAAGVRVRGGVEGEAARRLNAPFFWRHAAGRDPRPFVSLKLALSLDGHLAARPGVRTQLTGDEARAWVHHLRAGHETILIGRRTAQVDDPLLTVRGEVRPRRAPARLVLDSQLRLDPASRLARTADEAPVWAISGPDAAAERRERLERLGIRVLALPLAEAGGVDLRHLLRRLGAEGIRTLLVEGGGRVAASFLAARLVERLYLLRAPVVLGPEGVPGFPKADVWSAVAWRVVDRGGLGRDTLVVFEQADLDRKLRISRSADPTALVRAPAVPRPTCG